MRGETPLQAGWLMAVQGLGAMITMPIAGALIRQAARSGGSCRSGWSLIIGGMFALTQLTATTLVRATSSRCCSSWVWAWARTMMPLMTSALKTLKSHDVARGSTLLNISQQIASSIGVAIMSVVLTNGLKNDPLVSGGPEFAEATKGVVDPAQLGTIAGKFPAVGEILARYADNLGAFQEALLARGARGDGERVRQHLLGRRDPAHPHAHPGVLPAAQARGVAPARRRRRRGRRARTVMLH